jgi:hypothetical protein
MCRNDIYYSEDLHYLQFGRAIDNAKTVLFRLNRYLTLYTVHIKTMVIYHFFAGKMASILNLVRKSARFDLRKLKGIDQ